MTLNEQVAKNIIKKLLNGNDYRIEIIALINAEFLQFCIDFFKQVIEAKLKNKNITIDWYKKEFLNLNLSSEQIAINSGLNKKTIVNMYNKGSKEIVIDASNEHYDILFESINSLVENNNDIDLNLTIKFRGISVDLNINESLIVINTLAVKRSALRGGLWSTAGKKVEKPLMVVLCNLFGVSDKNFAMKIKDKIITNFDFQREIDFYLINKENNYKCEVKLMGRGNPESADIVIARNSKVFIGDKLSDTNKKQLDSLKINWVELRTKNGYLKFGEVLDNLKIPYKNNKPNIQNLDNILNLVFKVL